MADRKRAPKINALNVERANLIVQIIRYAFDALVTVIPPTPKLHAAIEMFKAWAHDFSCFRATNYLPAGRVRDENDPSTLSFARVGDVGSGGPSGAAILSAFSEEVTDLGRPETCQPGTFDESPEE